MEEYEEQRQQYEENKMSYDEDIKDWQRQDRKKGVPRPAEPQPPTAVRHLVNNVTIEALITLLCDNPRGLLCANDELSSWLGGMDRYVGKGGGEAGLWLSMFQAKSITVDRKTTDRKMVHVRRAAVSIVGGIPPQTLRRLLTGEHLENGLAARLLVAMPPRLARRFSQGGVSREVEARIRRLYAQLLTLDFAADADGKPIPVEVAMDFAAQAVFEQFVNEHGEEQTLYSGHLASVWSKLEGYAARFALLFALVRWAVDEEGNKPPKIVTVEDVEAAIELVEWFGRQWRRVDAMLHEDAAQRERRELVEWIGRQGGAVTARLLQQGKRQFRTADEARAALDDLVASGNGDWIEIRTTPQGGRPSRQFRLRQLTAVYGTPSIPEGN